MKRDGRNLVELDESRRKHMLSRVLLHMIAPALGVDLTTHKRTCGRQARRSVKVMQHRAGVVLRDFSNAHALGADCQPSRIVNLAAAVGIEGALAQNHSWS